MEIKSMGNKSCGVQEGLSPLFLFLPPLLWPRCTKGKTFVRTFALGRL
jgi:hypothetical protein